MHWPECVHGSQLDVEFFILEIPVMNHKTWVEEPFSDTLVRRKFVLVFSGVLAKDCSLTRSSELQLLFSVRVVLYATENHLWEDFTTFSAAVDY